MNGDILFSQHPVGLFTKQFVSQSGQLQIAPQLVGQLQESGFWQKVTQTSDIPKSIGISEYKPTRTLPKRIKSSQPSIKEIEKELGPKK